MSRRLPPKVESSIYLHRKRSFISFVNCSQIVHLNLYKFSTSLGVLQINIITEILIRILASFFLGDEAGERQKQS